MQNYYVRFGRRHPIPSTVEILDELRSGYMPGYVRKSYAQCVFAKPKLCDAKPPSAYDENSDPSITQEEHYESSSSTFFAART